MRRKGPKTGKYGRGKGNDCTLQGLMRKMERRMPTRGLVKVRAIRTIREVHLVVSSPPRPSKASDSKAVMDSLSRSPQLSKSCHRTITCSVRKASTRKKHHSSRKPSRNRPQVKLQRLNLPQIRTALFPRKRSVVKSLIKLRKDCPRLT